MFEALAQAIDEVEIPADAAAIAEAIALRSRLDAHIAGAVGAFDRAALWDLDAATSVTAWLKDHGMSRRDAARATTVARRLATLPVTAAAWRDGALSAGQIDVILSTVDAATLPLFADDEAAVVPRLIGASINDTVATMRSWHEAASNRTPEPAGSDEPERRVHLSRTFGGQWALDGELDPLTGETVATALRLAEQPDVEGEPRRTPAERRADALGELARFFLDHQQGVRGGRHRPHLNIVMDLDAAATGAAATFIDGGALDGSAAQALPCDSALHRVLRAGGSTILDYGRATRSVPAPLWNALVLRDEHCRFPGCERPSWWCDGHHVIEWVKNGDTGLWNLVLLCRRHHRRLHQPGWEAKLLPDGTFEVTDPNGRVRSSRPPGSLTLAG